MGSWLTLDIHVIGSLPVGWTTPNRTSATPCPSVPGNQAATRAFQLGNWAAMSNGRPDTSTTTTGTPAARNVLRELRSVVSRPIAPGRSPAPSAYGDSPTTAIAAR